MGFVVTSASASGLKGSRPFCSHARSREMPAGSLRLPFPWPARYLHRLLHYQRVGVHIDMSHNGRFSSEGRFAVSVIGVPRIGLSAVYSFVVNRWLNFHSHGLLGRQSRTLRGVDGDELRVPNPGIVVLAGILGRSF